VEREPAPPLRIEFVRMRRARRYILRIRPDGTVRVTVPRGGSRREAEAFVAENRKWIEREQRRVGREHAPAEWYGGFEILLRGRPVEISVAPSTDGVVIRYGERIVRAAAGVGVRRAVETDLRALAAEELGPRLQQLAAQHGLSVRGISIRNQRSRWGSCGRNGHIALNFRLVQMPQDVRDYVLLHELMHLRQQNHGRRFWRLVEAACPAFREAERWLKTTGRALF
jgi:predicted metal-dependent hydrolase